VEQREPKGRSDGRGAAEAWSRQYVDQIFLALVASCSRTACHSMPSDQDSEEAQGLPCRDGNAPMSSNALHDAVLRVGAGSFHVKRTVLPSDFRRMSRGAQTMFHVEPSSVRAEECCRTDVGRVQDAVY
jgi:hypothetical protein